MTSLDALLNAYIDANIILALGALIWVGTQFCLQRTTLRRAHGTQLRLLYGVLLTVGALPFLILALAPQLQLLNLSLSDRIVAEYLDGRFAMTPTNFEAWLNFRSHMVVEVTTLSTLAGQMIAAGLVLGVALASYRVAANFWTVRTIIARSYHWRSTKRVEIRLSEQMAVPFSTRGLFLQYVIIPSDLLSNPRDLRVALAHEFQHLRQGDLTWEAVLELLRPIFVFNPAMGYWKRQVECRRELACDQAVMRSALVSPQDYANCLLNICRKAVTRPVADPQLTVPLLRYNGTKNAALLKDRVINLIARDGGAHSRWVAPALLAPLIVIFTLSSVAIQRSGDWSHDRLMLSTIVNLERLEQHNGQRLR